MSLATEKTIKNVSRILEVLKDGPLPIVEILEQINEFGENKDTARQAFYNAIHSSTMAGRVVSTSNNRYDNKYKITIPTKLLIHRFIMGLPLGN